MQDNSEIIIESNACVYARLGDWKINEENLIFRIQQKIALFIVFYYNYNFR